MNLSDFLELQVALRAVDAAASVAEAIQSKLVVDAISKEDRSPVTVADFASQAVVAQILESSLGEVVLVGEESADLLATESNQKALDTVVDFVKDVIPNANRTTVCSWIDRGAQEPGEAFWTLDPIDGTKGFLRREHYAVALGYVVSGKVQIAALACPKLSDPTAPHATGSGSVLFAVRDHGAFWMPQGDVSSTHAQRLRVSQIVSPAEARMLRSVESGHTNTGSIGELVELLQIQAEPVGLDSQAKYAVLAGGAAELLVRFISSKAPNYKEKIWDQAAGSLIVEEAGGRVTDLDGKPLDFSQGRELLNNRGVLGTNGLLHDAFVDAIRMIGA